MIIVYFITSVILSVDFVKIMVDVCNPQNYPIVKFIFLCSFETQFCGP